MMEAMKQSGFEQFKAISAIIFPFFAILILFFFLDLENIIKLGNFLNLKTILVVIAISLLRPLFGGFRASFAYKPITQLNIIDASKGYVLSAYGTIFFPSTIGGDILRVEHMKNCTGSTRKEAFLVAGLERIMGFLCLLFLTICCVYFLYYFDIVIITKPISIQSIWFVNFTIIFIACICILIFGINKLQNYKIFNQVREYISGYATPFLLIGMFILSLVFQFISLSIPIIVGYALGGSDVAINIALITPLVALFSTLPISIGGFGIREASYVGIGALFPGGIDNEISFLVGLSLSFSIIISGLPGIFFQNELFSVKKKNKKIYESE